MNRIPVIGVDPAFVVVTCMQWGNLLQPAAALPASGAMGTSAKARQSPRQHAWRSDRSSGVGNRNKNHLRLFPLLASRPSFELSTWKNGASTSDLSTGQPDESTPKFKRGQSAQSQTLSLRCECDGDVPSHTTRHGKAIAALRA